MSDTYTVILENCPADQGEELVLLLCRFLGIKDVTARSVVQSAPIAILPKLTRNQAAAMVLAIRPLQLKGAIICVEQEGLRDLPRIDWPRLPQIWKLDLDDFVQLCQISLPMTRNATTLLELLHLVLDGVPIGVESDAIPAPSAQPDPPNRTVFTGADLGEITPFSNRIVSDTPATPAPSQQQLDTGDLASRMDELFPEDGAGGGTGGPGLPAGDQFVPDGQTVTSLLDQLLPEDGKPASGLRAAARMTTESPRLQQNAAAVASASFSVFLPRIADEARRQKAIGLLCELSGISKDEADSLTKKVIIPALRGVTREQAESAKHRFAEIGVLARVREG